MGFNINYKITTKNSGVLTGTYTNADLFRQFMWNTNHTNTNGVIDNNYYENITDLQISGDADTNILGTTRMGDEGTEATYSPFRSLRITKLDMSKVNLSKITNMTALFSNMPNLVTLDLTGVKFATTSINANYMFQGDTSLLYIYVDSNFVKPTMTSDYLYSSYNMWTGCTALGVSSDKKGPAGFALKSNGGYLTVFDIEEKNSTIYEKTEDGDLYKIYPITKAENVEGLTTAITSVVGNLHLWTGTQAEYDAITTKDSNTLYFIKAGD